MAASSRDNAAHAPVSRARIGQDAEPQNQSFARVLNPITHGFLHAAADKRRPYVARHAVFST